MRSHWRDFESEDVPINRISAIPIEFAARERPGEGWEVKLTFSLSPEQAARPRRGRPAGEQAERVAAIADRMREMTRAGTRVSRSIAIRRVAADRIDCQPQWRGFARVFAEMERLVPDRAFPEARMNAAESYRRLKPYAERAVRRISDPASFLEVRSLMLAALKPFLTERTRCFKALTNLPSGLKLSPGTTIAGIEPSAASLELRDASKPRCWVCDARISPFEAECRGAVLVEDGAAPSIGLGFIGFACLDHQDELHERNKAQLRAEIEALSVV